MTLNQLMTLQKNSKPVAMESIKGISSNFVTVDDRIAKHMKKQSAKKIFNDKKVLETLKLLSRV